MLAEIIDNYQYSMWPKIDSRSYTSNTNSENSKSVNRSGHSSVNILQRSNQGRTCIRFRLDENAYNIQHLARKPERTSTLIRPRLYMRGQY